jgi:hypothetical protein
MGINETSLSSFLRRGGRVGLSFSSRGNESDRVRRSWWLKRQKGSVNIRDMSRPLYSLPLTASLPSDTYLPIQPSYRTIWPPFLSFSRKEILPKRPNRVDVASHGTLGSLSPARWTIKVSVQPGHQGSHPRSKAAATGRPRRHPLLGSDYRFLVRFYGGIR